MNMIAESLKRFREKLGYSQEGLADSIGMSQTTYSGWEKNPPASLELLVKFAIRYGFSTDYILGLIDSPQQVSGKSLPSGAQEIIEYLAEMSPRGREQLLKVARILYEDDQDWKQREAALKFLARIASDTGIAPRADELPTLLAEFGSLDALARHFAETVTEDISPNQGN